jgi:glycogen phosphorylase
MSNSNNFRYERHLVFDDERSIPNGSPSARTERFEAFSSFRAGNSRERWVQTKNTYERQNAKRIYYLSMEFLIGRSLANNITNLLLDPLLQRMWLERMVSTGWN